MEKNEMLNYRYKSLLEVMSDERGGKNIAE